MKLINKITTQELVLMCKKTINRKSGDLPNKVRRVELGFSGSLRTTGD